MNSLPMPRAEHERAGEEQRRDRRRVTHAVRQRPREHRR